MTEGTHEDEGIETTAYASGPEIPSKLYAKVYENYEKLMSAQVQVKRGGGWSLLPKRMRFPADGAQQFTVDEICNELIVIAIEDAKRVDHDCNYRAMLTVRDEQKGSVKRYAPIIAQQNADGDIEVFDAPDLNEKDHIGIYRDMLRMQMDQNNRLFNLNMQSQGMLADKVGNMADKVGDQCEKMGQLADGFSAIAGGVGTVLTNSAAFFNAGIELTREREEESTALAIHRMDHEMTLEKLKAVLEMFGPAGKELAKQVSSTMAKKFGKKPALPAKTEEANPAATVTQIAKDASESEPNMGKRLALFLAKLDERKREGTKAIIGDEHYVAMVSAAEAENDEKGRAACLAFRKSMDAIAETNRWEAMGRLAQLNSLLGDDLTEEFGKMLPDPEKKNE